MIRAYCLFFSCLLYDSHWMNNFGYKSNYKLRQYHVHNHIGLILKQRHLLEHNEMLYIDVDRIP